MEDALRERYARLADVDLLFILERAEGYRPEALEAARAELTTRKLDGPISEELQQALEQKVLQETSLTGNERVVRILVPFWPGWWMQAQAFKQDGAIRKHRESLQYLKLGLFSYLAVVVMAMIYFRISFNLW